VTAVLWDASALVKGFVIERGSESVDVVFRIVPLQHMICTFLSYAETVSVLVRKKNQGMLRAGAFEAALASLQSDVIFSADLLVLESVATTVMDSVEYIIRHNINAADAVLLVTYLGYVRAGMRTGDRAILVTADARLERAALAEGLTTINPERLNPAAVEAVLATH
jgi:predicted nucleic acid-binding protein